LFSLAARRLGARVHSIDCDPEAVACTRELKRRYAHRDALWKIDEGSLFENEFLYTLGRFDVVYSWGVLHHTGRMWDALGQILGRVDDDGELLVALNNHRSQTHEAEMRIRRLYNSLPGGLRWLPLTPFLLRRWGPTMVRDMIRGRPGNSWRNYSSLRGGSAWGDLVAEIGWLPCEVAAPDDVIAYCTSRGFELSQINASADDRECVEFVFCRANSTAARQKTSGATRPSPLTTKPGESKNSAAFRADSANAQPESIAPTGN
jgi:2-polyprenyl-6-hydroxyphenyl methylase/3-demethylubiquinone-9 3-methyltransferase